MIIKFENDTRTFEYTAEGEPLENVLNAVRDGLIAMGHHPETAKQFLKELIEGEDDD